MRSTHSTVLAALQFATCVALAQALPAQGTFNVNSPLDTNDANPGDGACADANGNCTLRAAIQEANARGGASTIVIQPGQLYMLTIDGAGEDAALTGDLDVTAMISIDGRGVTVDAGGLDRIFDVQSGASLNVDQLWVQNGAVVAQNGGGYRSAGTLLLERSRVTNSSATGAGGSGGAISDEGGTLTVSRTYLLDNDSERAGGAIEANAGSTEVRDSKMSGNTTGPAPGNGGALHLTGTGDVVVVSTDVLDNSAASEGGGLWNSAVGEMVVTRSVIDHNSAAGNDSDQGGGGLFNDGGMLRVMGTFVRNNTATGTSGSGGDILNNLGSLIVSRSVVANNDSQRTGGGIEANVGTTTLSGVRMIANTTGAAPGNGGGLHLTGAGSVSVDRSSVLNNDAAAEGGGLWNSATGTMTVTNTPITGNTSPIGSQVFSDGGTFTVDGVPVAPGP